MLKHKRTVLFTGFPITQSTFLHKAPLHKSLTDNSKTIVYLINANDIPLNTVTIICLCACRDKTFLLRY